MQKLPLYIVRSIFILLSIPFSLQTANAQTGVDTMRILEKVVRTQNDTITFIYTDYVDSFYLNKLKPALSKNLLCGFIGKGQKHCITLTKEDALHIDSQLNKFKQPYWRERLFA